jgi:hypothetical protein
MLRETDKGLGFIALLLLGRPFNQLDQFEPQHNLLRFHHPFDTSPAAWKRRSHIEAKPSTVGVCDRVAIFKGQHGAGKLMWPGPPIPPFEVTGPEAQRLLQHIPKQLTVEQHERASRLWIAVSFVDSSARADSDINEGDSCEIALGLLQHLAKQLNGLDLPGSLDEVVIELLLEQLLDALGSVLFRGIGREQERIGIRDRRPQVGDGLGERAALEIFGLACFPIQQGAQRQSHCVGQFFLANAPGKAELAQVVTQGC